MSIKAGDLRQIVTLQRPVSHINEKGRRVTCWENVATVHAGRADVSGREFYVAQAYHAEDVVTFTIRWREDVTAQWRILHRGAQYDMREKILGRYRDANGVQIVKGGQKAPFVAIAFALTLDDGSKELWTLYKGKFAEPSQTGHTDSDTMTYQHPTIEGTFIRREYDDALAAIAATSDPNVMETVKTGWFEQVYEAVAA